MSVKINSVNNESWNNTFKSNAKKKNEKYLKGADIFFIPLKSIKSDKNNLLNISRIIIANKITGKITAVVPKNAEARLYSLNNDTNDSINKDGLGKILCVNHVNSNNIM